MTQRTQRRAAERKARKAEEKKLRHQAQNVAFKSAYAAGAQQAPVTEPVLSEPLPTRELKLAAISSPSSTSTVSEAQLAANRVNAQRSQGPVTDLGKSISSRNNFRHGLTQTEADPILLDSESKTEYAQWRADYQQEWQPATATEHDLVNRLVTHSWLRRRSLGLQKLFLRPEDGLITDEKQFNLYRRYEIQHERAFNKALSDLIRLRGLRIREQNGFESQRRQNERHEYQIRHQQHREKLQHLAELTAQARLALAQGKLSKANTRPTGDAPPFVDTPAALSK